MQKKSFSIILLVLIYIIFALDLAANQYFLYWKLWWFDMVLHFLGGLWIALVSYYILFFSGYKRKFKKVKEKYSITILILVLVIGVGVLWEVFEYVMGAVPKTGHILDTCLDLLMDIIGGSVGYLLISKKYILAKR